MLLVLSSIFVVTHLNCLLSDRPSYIYKDNCRRLNMIGRERANRDPIGCYSQWKRVTQLTSCMRTNKNASNWNSMRWRALSIYPQMIPVVRTSSPSCPSLRPRHTVADISAAVAAWIVVSWISRRSCQETEPLDFHARKQCGDWNSTQGAVDILWRFPRAEAVSGRLDGAIRAPTGVWVWVCVWGGRLCGWVRVIDMVVFWRPSLL